MDDPLSIDVNFNQMVPQVDFIQQETTTAASSEVHTSKTVSQIAHSD